MTDENGPQEVVRQQAEAFQKIVDDALEHEVGVEDFLGRLRRAGATPAEAADYGNQYSERKNRGPSGTSTIGSEPSAGGQEATPEGLDDGQRLAFRTVRDAELANAAARASRERQDAVDAAAWKVLEAKLRKAEGNKGQSHIGKDFGTRLAELLGESEPAAPSGFPASVLGAAPHLKQLGSRAFDDPHLGTTWRLKRAYEKEVAAIDAIFLYQYGL